MNSIRYKTLEKPLKMLFKVEISEKTLLKEDKFLRLFEIDIIPEKASFWSGNQNIEILRRPGTVSRIPDNNVDAFVQQIAAALNQLTFKLGTNGMPVSIEKQNELWRKWLEIRAVIAASYSGDWIDRALSEVDQKMLPSMGLKQTIMQDIFLNEYFRGIHDASFVEDHFNCQRTVFGICPFPLLFNENWTLQSSSYEHQVISFSGKSNENSTTAGFTSWLKTKTDDPDAQITVNGFYQVNNQTGWCSALQSMYIITTANSYEKSINVTLTTN